MQDLDLNTHLNALAAQLQPTQNRDRRRHRRVPIVLAGTMLDGRGQEHAFEIIDCSAGGIRIRTLAKCPEGDKVVLYCQAIGRLTGQVARTSNEELAIAMNLPQLKKDKLVEALTWQINKAALRLQEERRSERYNTSGETTCRMESGRELVCRVLDISVLGMSLETREKRPHLGEHVMIGRHKGVVARYTEQGFAVDFANGLKAADPLD